MDGSKLWGVIPAAGVGSRMDSMTPKQYLPLLGKTILERTISVLSGCPDIRGICVAIAEGDSYWPGLGLMDTPGILVTKGGAERAHSVLNALNYLLEGQARPGDWVLVHDAARPCLPAGDLNRLIDAVRGKGNGGILARPVVETVKRVDDQGVILQTVDRRDLWAAQTPQMFRLDQLRDALDQGLATGCSLTDEASAMELAGHSALVVEGHPENIKITTPYDLDLAETLMTKRPRTDSD